jgi:hypothetical protein
MTAASAIGTADSALSVCGDIGSLSNTGVHRVMINALKQTIKIFALAIIFTLFEDMFIYQAS